MVFFPTIARAAQRLQVADVVRTAFRERYDMIDSEIGFAARFAATLALRAIAIENIFPHFWRNANPGRLAHNKLY